jgi:hypothetical protein
VHLDEPFEVAGQTWRVAEIRRRPVLMDWEIVLRRVT